MQLVSASMLAISPIIPMGTATGRGGLTGAGYRAIGFGVITNDGGSMDITGLADEII